ncbi:MAG: divergent PAP2 family protein [Candidatus Nomurabacteria bacterium]|jgi:acid phosphatase family membrane protein YuiD|nr:divergent PAP2 family protein [Candidatus Nomurabacteria bacterium]
MEWLPPYLVAVVAAWLVANLTKVVISAVRNKKLSQKPAFATGGMPSAHTAPAVALTTAVGLREGVDSAIFALALVLAVVIMVDAVHARRAVGEQGVALQKLLSKTDQKPYLARGHKPLEVLVSALIGIAVGVVTFYL